MAKSTKASSKPHVMKLTDQQRNSLESYKRELYSERDALLRKEGLKPEDFGLRPAPGSKPGQLYRHSSLSEKDLMKGKEILDRIHNSEESFLRDLESERKSIPETSRSLKSGQLVSGPTISSILKEIEKAKSMKKTEELEAKLSMLVDPEEHGFDSIQDMLYTDDGMKELKRISLSSRGPGSGSIDIE
jgi:hypothetical protein